MIESCNKVTIVSWLKKSCIYFEKWNERKNKYSEVAKLCEKYP